MPEKLDNPALFPWLGLLSTLIRQENGALQNVLQTRGIWKCQLYVLVWTENILKTELFENNNVSMIWDFPAQVFHKHQSKMAGNCCIFKFLWCSVDGKTFDAFLEWERCFFFLNKSLQCSVDTSDVSERSAGWWHIRLLWPTVMPEWSEKLTQVHLFKCKG